MTTKGQRKQLLQPPKNRVGVKNCFYDEKSGKL